MRRIKGRGLCELASGVLNWRLWKGRDISQTLDQSQHTAPADQSEYSVLFRRRGFIETGTKQSITDGLKGA